MQRDERLEHRLGIVVAAVIALLFSSMFVVQEWRRRPAGAIEFEVLVPIAQGLESLSAGSDVVHAGIDIGRVEEVTLAESGEDLLVRFSVDPRFRLGDGAALEEGVPMVGPRSTLVLLNAGIDAAEESDRASRPSWKPGDGLTRLVGAEPARSFRRAFANLDDVRGRIGRIGEAEDLVDELRAAVTSLSERVPGDFAKWRESATATLAELPEFTGPDAVVPRADVDDLRDRVENMRESMLAIDARIRPQLEGTRADWNVVRSDLDAIRARWIDVVQPDFDRLRARLDTFESSFSSADVGELRVVGALARHSLARFAADISLSNTEIMRARSEVIASLGVALIARPPAERIAALRELDSLRSWAESAETLLSRLELLDDALAAADDGADPRMRALANDAARTMRTALDRHEAIQQDVLSLVGRLLRTAPSSAIPESRRGPAPRSTPGADADGHSNQ